MEQNLKEFIYNKNGWPIPITPRRINPNIRNEKIGTLWLDGKVFAKGSFALIQRKKKEYCTMYGISKERAKERFKTTY